MTFEQIFQHTLRWESEGCHRAAGEDWWTCWGVAEKFNPDIFGEGAEGENGLPSKEQAFRRAKERYWDPVGLEGLPPGLQLVVFDHGFNAGPERAKAMLSPGDTHVSYSAKRMTFYTSPQRRNRGLNLPGWINRVADIMMVAERAAESDSEGLGVVVLHNLTTPILGGLGDRLLAAWRGYQRTAEIVVRQPAVYQVRPSTQDPSQLKLDVRFKRES